MDEEVVGSGRIGEVIKCVGAQVLVSHSTALFSSKLRVLCSY